MSSVVTLIALILCIATVTYSAVPKKDRVITSKLSDEDPGSKDYDHESFMGEEGAKEFAELSPEESKRRLGVIFDKIDTNSDGTVTEEELEHWITKTQRRYIDEDTEKEFKNHDPDRSGNIHWDEYYNMTFGFLQDEDWNAGDDRGYSYKDMLRRDRNRWKVADRDGDDSCTLEEYKAFLHPEEYDHMKDTVLEETMDDMDKDKDGFINMEEYIGDMYRPETPNEKEPEWVQTEREQFTQHRDEDKDGKLNKEELRKWILPDDYNHAKAESAHLVYMSDSDKDGVLSKDEMIDHHDVFVGSQATEWGEMFKRHDEF